MAHQASCLLVSHDRSFVRAVGNRFWQIERRRLVEVEEPERFFASATLDFSSRKEQVQKSAASLRCSNAA